MWTLKEILIVGGLVRLLLIYYGRIQDYVLDVKFTDIDYHVFCDAARYVYYGQSPYKRATYRYTPVLAYLLVPTVNHPEFGKILFNLCDMAVGLLIYKILISGKRSSETESVIGTAIWLFNPLTAVISSRGNAEALVALTVLLTLYLLEEKKSWLLAGVLHGFLAINLKIYPVIYVPSVFLYLMDSKNGGKYGFLNLLTNFKGFAYAFVTVFSFAVAVGLSYWKFGEEFLNEALLYHVSRSDIRHNFSPYFYPMYLARGQPWAKLISTTAFIPQLTLTLIFAFRYAGKNLGFCWFLTTFAFVSFNKGIIHKLRDTNWGISTNNLISVMLIKPRLPNKLKPKIILQIILEA